MTELDIHLVLLEISNTIADNFQFWLATTFAVVVVTYTAGQRLQISIRAALAVVYLMAAWMFFLRYQMSSDQAAFYFQLLREMNSDLPAPHQGLVTILRKSVMLAGSFLAVIFLFVPSWTRIAEKPESET
ncbi:MAG: hypothetical protein GWP02_05765 [Desulfobulbaceae bacterium]|nr:hypothetical protein [Desulfobulbaceae bacterium]